MSVTYNVQYSPDLDAWTVSEGNRQLVQRPTKTEAQSDAVLMAKVMMDAGEKASVVVYKLDGNIARVFRYPRASRKV